jgi:hypothetical protein
MPAEGRGRARAIAAAACPNEQLRQQDDDRRGANCCRPNLVAALLAAYLCACLGADGADARAHS